MTLGGDRRPDHPPAGVGLFSPLKLAGVEPTATATGSRRTCRCARWSLRLPNVGVAQDRGGVLRGYVRPERGGPLRFEVVPRGGPPARPVVRVDGRRVAATVDGGTVRFTATGRSGVALDWSVAAH